MMGTDTDSGSTRVSRVGEGVSPSRTSQLPATAENAHYTRRNLPHFERPWAIYALTIGVRKNRTISASSRDVVLNAFRHFHQQRYELFAVCVMPDHVHALLQPWPKGDGNSEDAPLFWTLAEILHSIKSFTAHKINEIEHVFGAVWEQEAFDRYIRSDRDLAEKFQYILRNPWDAGVVAVDEIYPWVWTQDDATRHETDDSGSSSRRDAATNARDARAPRN